MQLKLLAERAGESAGPGRWLGVALSRRNRDAARRAAWLGAVWLLVAVVPAARAQRPPAEAWRVESREWRRPAAGLERMSLKNLEGDVRARGGDGDVVYLRLAVQRHRDDPRVAEIVAEEGFGGLALEVRFAQAPEVAEPPDWTPRRIDAALFLPRRLAAAITTGAGLVELRGLEGDAEIETRTGDVQVRTSGRLTARSDRGAILAHFLRTGWAAPAEIETVSGEIRVHLPSGGGARAEIETRGEITTDYSLEIDKEPGRRLKRARLVIGGGGPVLRLRSARGAVRLLESAVPEAEPPPEEPGP